MSNSDAILALYDKICDPRDLPTRLSRLPRPLVFTNGVFDVLHRGHVQYLTLNPEDDRAVVMAALASTSLVTWFDEDTPLELITQVRPEILVKGGDYDMQTLAETRVVEAYGGRALALPFVNGYSTSALVRKIRQ